MLRTFFPPAWLAVATDMAMGMASPIVMSMNMAMDMAMTMAVADVMAMDMAIVMAQAIAKAKATATGIAVAKAKVISPTCIKQFPVRHFRNDRSSSGRQS